MFAESREVPGGGGRSRGAGAPGSEARPCWAGHMDKSDPGNLPSLESDTSRTCLWTKRARRVSPSASSPWGWSQTSAAR